MVSANFSVYLPVSKEFHQRRCFLRPFYIRVDISLEMRILFSKKFSEYSKKFMRILKCIQNEYEFESIVFRIIWEKYDQ